MIRQHDAAIHQPRPTRRAKRLLILLEIRAAVVIPIARTAVDRPLDLPDEILSRLDYVIVSIHSAFNLSEAEMTARVIRAIENPFVTILAHPTGRLLLKREPYQIDIPAVLDAAARTGTWIELNAAPKRLDLDWRWWPLAKQKGVKCAINPDAHRTERLQDLWFGIGIARKGWLTKDDVINCLPLGNIERALKAKRHR